MLTTNQTNQILSSIELTTVFDEDGARLLRATCMVCSGKRDYRTQHVGTTLIDLVDDMVRHYLDNHTHMLAGGDA